MEIVAEKAVIGGMLRLIKGDITTRDTDAIVNAANSHLQHGGGVAGAIVRKGGSVIQAESDSIGYVPVGGAAVTSSGTLPCKAVIHAVGPCMGEGDEDNKLKNAVLNSLKLASQNGFKSVSMPAISSGIFGFPKDRCAKILVTESRNFLRENPESGVNIVEFCIYDSETLQCFVSEFNSL